MKSSRFRSRIASALLNCRRFVYNLSPSISFRDSSSIRCRFPYTVSGVSLKLSWLLLKIYKWVLLNMSMNRKYFGLNGRFSTNCKLKKMRESHRTSNDGWEVRKLLCLMWLFLVVTGLSCLFRRLETGVFKREGEAKNVFTDKKIVSTEHFNVSWDKFQELASSFFNSDEIRSIKCTKRLEHGGPQGTVIMCALEMPVMEDQSSGDNHVLAADNGESYFQCPVLGERILPEVDPSFSGGSSLLSIVSQSEQLLAFNHSNYGKKTEWVKELLHLARDQCYANLHCSVKLCSFVLVVLAGSYKILILNGKLWGILKQKLFPAHKQKEHTQTISRSAGKWRKILLVLFVLSGCMFSVWLFWHVNADINFRRKETLANMCDERARMLQDQFNVSMNHVHALALLVSTFYHGKDPPAINQKTFGEYTERTAFERPLTSGVAYALRVPHSEREKFEQLHGWAIKKMEKEDQTLVQDCIPENLDPSPVQDEYAPVIFSQESVSHIVSIDMMSGMEDRKNILRARASGKGVLTSPFKLLKSNHLGVVLTFAVYNAHLPLDATPEQRTNATVGYLGASYDIPSLVEKLLYQLASKQTIDINVYDTTNMSVPINMYGANVTDTGLLHISGLDFGDPARKHEMRCRFKQKPSPPWTAIIASGGVIVITLLLGHIFYAAINRIAKVERDYRDMMELKHRAEAADIAKSQFLATVSHEIRTPMNGVLGMLQMLMDTNLDAKQLDYAQTAHASGKDLISLINEVLDQAKIESGRLELEAVPFDLRAVLDNVVSLFSRKSQEKGIELAVYVSGQVPEIVVGDPVRFRQIVTNLVGNSIKFTHDRGHIFISVHLVEEVRYPNDAKDEVLSQSLVSFNGPPRSSSTLSGCPVVKRWKSWSNFKEFGGTDSTGISKVLVTVEDTGVGIPLDAQSRIFMPFMQADSSTSRTYGGTGIGLSISKRLVDLMGGEIGFVSEPGMGSTFSFTVAFAKQEISSTVVKLLHNHLAVSEFRGFRAFVIDGKSIRAEVTKYHLQRIGIFVETSSSLDSARSMLLSKSSKSESDHPTAILVDQELWDKEAAVSFLSFLKEHRRNAGSCNAENVPKIFLVSPSMGSNVFDELKSSKLVDNVLPRPLRLSVLISCFQETLVIGNKRQLLIRKTSTLGILLKNKKILVVDDNIVNRRVAEGALKKCGAVVTCVGSGKAALEMLKPPHCFDACFMDLQMPELDGFEATRQIRKLESKVNEQILSGEASTEAFANVAYWHIPILAMTADVIQATNEECMKCGMDGYVSKPFEEEQLYSAAARFFEANS